MSARRQSQPSSKTTSRAIKTVPSSKGGKTGTARTGAARTDAVKYGTAKAGYNLAERLPTEVLLTLFSYFDANDLLVAARVCSRWLTASNDNLLWRKMYEKYLPKSKNAQDIGVPLDTPTLFWKTQCVKKSVEFRNERVLSKLNRNDPFTLLPSNIRPNLQQFGVIFTLAFFDRSGTHHYIRHSDSFYHRMSVTARWYSFGALPAISRLQTLKVISLNPVFYNQKGNACKNSPCQRSLLFQTEFDWTNLTSQTPIGSDSTVDVYSLQPGIAVAVWRDGGGLAYIVANFHYDNLIQRCIRGTFKEAHPVQSTLDSTPAQGRSGVHSFSAGAGFSATVELRNQRQSIWSQQFRCLDVLYSKEGCLYTLQAIRSNQRAEHTPLEKNVELPWKTDLFKNKIPNLCVLDVCLRNPQGRLEWSVSDFVQSVANDLPKVSYDYEGQGRVIRYQHKHRKVIMVIDMDSVSEKQVVSSLMFHL